MLPMRATGPSSGKVGSSHLPSVLCFSRPTVLPQSHQSPLHSTVKSHTEPSQCSGEGDAEGANDGDDGNGVEDTNVGTDDNVEGELNSKSADPRQGLAGKCHLSPSSSSLDEGLTDTEPNPPRHKGQSTHYLP